MEPKIRYALENLLLSRKDLFGNEASFVTFKNEKSKFGEVNDLFVRIFYGRIMYYTDGKLCPSESLAIKLVQENGIVEFYEMTTIANEVFFYAKILPFFHKFRGIDHLFPRYLSNVTQANNNSVESVAIMENLKAQGYDHAPGAHILDYPHLSLMMKKLGEFHAYSYHIKEKDPLRFSCLSGSIGQNLNKFALFCSRFALRFLQPIGDVLLEDFQYSWSLKDSDTFVEICRKLLTEGLEDDPHDPNLVLCHGDFHDKNFMFKYTKEELVDGKIINLGNCTWTTPPLDLGWVLMANTDQKLRDEKWDDLIDVYYGALCQTFADTQVPSRESIVGDLPKKLIFGAMFTALRNSPHDVLLGADKLKLEFHLLTIEDAIKIGNRGDQKSRIDVFKEVLNQNGYRKGKYD